MRRNKEREEAPPDLPSELHCTNAARERIDVPREIPGPKSSRTLVSSR
jgi:hypothetical protein